MKFNVPRFRCSRQILLLDRYLINEFVRFFLFSVSLLTSLGVAIGNISDLAYQITDEQLPIWVAMRIFCYKIPEYAGYALPISMLLTALVVYSRLNSDRALVALMSFGISFYRIVLPTIIFSFMIMGIAFLLNELIVPAANYQAYLLQSSFIDRTELNLQNQNIFYAEYESDASQNKLKKLKKIYFAEQYIKPNLLGVVILVYDGDRISQIITSKSANWNQQLQTWQLRSGIIHRFTADIDENTIEKFAIAQLSLPKTLFNIVNLQRSSEAMNIRQAQAYLNLIKDTSQPIYIAQIAVRIQQKYAFPGICLIFAVVGSALGAKYGQLNQAKSFGLCVGIVFIYYCLALVIGSLGITEVISPFWAAWLPNFIGLSLGIYLLAKVNN